MKAVLAGEIDTENELDVPTFIRRHSTHPRLVLAVQYPP